MVEGGGLENRCGATYLGFESLSLRHFASSKAMAIPILSYNLEMKKLLLITALFHSLMATATELPETDLQFFGDVWVPYHAMKATDSMGGKPRMFESITGLMDSARANVVNFEGVSSYSFIPYEYKRFLLKMPTSVPKLLRNANIHVASLANNHAMDYGFLGLFETIVGLNNAGIATLGAGKTLDEAKAPHIFAVGEYTVCLIAFSRTLPTSFWAKKNKSGTAFVDYDETEKLVKDCVADGHVTIPIFHWGAELSSTPKQYQKDLARLSIKAGAATVIGHHPHVLQSIEWYQGKPIFYSLGNFTFGSIPLGRKQEGMSVRMRFGKPHHQFDIVPINVNNDVVKYKPRLFSQAEEDPVSAVLLPGHRCQKNIDPVFWRCR